MNPGIKPEFINTIRIQIHIQRGDVDEYILILIFDDDCVDDQIKFLSVDLYLEHNYENHTT
jgi:hypothetical protein